MDVTQQTETLLHLRATETYGWFLTVLALGMAGYGVLVARKKPWGKTLAGYVAAIAEWHMLLALAADTSVVERGRTVPALSRARIKSFYDGTLFYRLAKENA